MPPLHAAPASPHRVSHDAPAAAPSRRSIRAASTATLAPTLALFFTNAMFAASDFPSVSSATLRRTKGVTALPDTCTRV